MTKWAASWQNQQNDLCARQTHISLGIHPVRSESLLYTHWVAQDPGFLHVNSNDSDQTGQMPSLIWVFAGRTGYFVGFVMRLFKWTCPIFQNRRIRTSGLNQFKPCNNIMTCNLIQRIASWLHTISVIRCSEWIHLKAASNANLACTCQNQQNDLCAQWRLGSDWGDHPPSLIRVWSLGYPSKAQQRLRSAWADAQADLSLCCAQRSFCWFCDAVAQIM